MALKILKHAIFLLLASSLTPHLSFATDPDLLSDFLLPPNITAVYGNFFSYTGFRVLVDAEVPAAFQVIKATKAEFPALNGQSVSYAALIFPPASVNPPHSHPRSAELLFIVDGSLDVGFVDTTGKLYTQTLQFGDMFIFPKGLLHYQYNRDANNPALALSAFGSASAGTVSVPSTLFVSGIEDEILAKSFKTDAATIKEIKAGLNEGDC